MADASPGPARLTYGGGGGGSRVNSTVHPEKARLFSLETHPLARPPHWMIRRLAHGGVLRNPAPHDKWHQEEEMVLRISFRMMGAVLVPRIHGSVHRTQQQRSRYTWGGTLSHTPPSPQEPPLTVVLHVSRFQGVIKTGGYTEVDTLPQSLTGALEGQRQLHLHEAAPGEHR